MSSFFFTKRRGAPVSHTSFTMPPTGAFSNASTPSVESTPKFDRVDRKREYNARRRRNEVSGGACVGVRRKGRRREVVVCLKARRRRVGTVRDAAGGRERGESFGASLLRRRRRHGARKNPSVPSSDPSRRPDSYSFARAATPLKIYSRATRNRRRRRRRTNNGAPPLVRSPLSSPSVALERYCFADVLFRPLVELTAETGMTVTNKNDADEIPTEKDNARNPPSDEFTNTCDVSSRRPASEPNAV